MITRKFIGYCAGLSSYRGRKFIIPARNEKDFKISLPIAIAVPPLWNKLPPELREISDPALTSERSVAKAGYQWRAVGGKMENRSVTHPRILDSHGMPTSQD